MSIYYYSELEKKERKIENKKVISSYFSTEGKLINCTSNHKGNNFTYTLNNIKIYLEIEKIRNLTPFDADKYLKDRKTLMMEILSKINIENMNDYPWLYYKYYNGLYSINPFPKKKEILENIKDIIKGEIQIYNKFILLKQQINKNNDRDKKILEKIIRNKDDALVQLVGFDKIESTLPKTITTSRANIMDAYFNYLILEWKIYQIPHYIYDGNSIKTIDFSTIDFEENREILEEIKLIKKYIPMEERKKYFR